VRITHVITRLIVGGAQENTLLTCRGLARRGHRVTLLSGPETGPEGSLIDDARALPIRLVLHPHMRRDVAPAHDLLEIAALVREFRATRPDVVHTHSSKAGILGRAAAWIAGVPAVVHTNHGLPFHESQPAPVRAAYRALERVASRVTDRIVCVGRDMVDQSLDARLGPRRLFTVVRSGMEVERFVNGDGADVRRDLAIPSGAPVVGAVARLAPQKGPEFFLDAASIIVERVPDAQFLWVGDGPLRESLAARAGLRRLPIRFVGLVPPERVPAYLGAMDVVLMTSLWEGLPRVVVQASLCARPVVAFDAPGVREVLVDGVTGRVAARGDARAMAEMACALLALPDRGRAMGLEARRRTAGEFRWERMVDDLDSLYASLARR